MFAHDTDLGILGIDIFKPVGEPVGVRISHHHDLDSGVFARRRCWCTRVVGGLPFGLSRPFSVPWIMRRSPLPIAPKAAEGVVRLLALLLPPSPGVSPKLRIRRKRESKNDESKRGRSDHRRKKRTHCKIEAPPFV